MPLPPQLMHTVNVREQLASAYGMLMALSENKYVATVSMDQLMDEAIRQLGGEELLAKGIKPLVGQDSRYAQLKNMQSQLQGVLDMILASPTLEVAHLLSAEEIREELEGASL